MYDQLRSFAYRLSRGQTYLPGLWERVGDTFAGCGVLIENTSQGLRGRITYVPAKMRHYGWQVGDVKWKGFVRGRMFAYQVEEMYKEVDRDTGKFKGAGFVEASIGFIGPDEIVVFPHGRRGVQSTRWCRSGVVTTSPPEEYYATAWN